jgi:prepilin-type processing-associated H-X9-DG protein
MWYFSGVCIPRRLHIPGQRSAFTLVEVLVVSGIILLLLSMLLPGLSGARVQAKAVMCRSNIRQIVIANRYYADDHSGIYCPGASDFRRNLHRWHGTRDQASQPFDSSRGPLVPYLGPDGLIRQCPAFPVDDGTVETRGFERGNGGYGYNNAFIGVQLAQYPSGLHLVVEDRAGAKADWVQRPADTIMFTDSGFAASGLIEYSFAEPRFHPQFPTFRADPSIHFRHRNHANIAWCDGHVDSHSRTFTWRSGLYRSDPERLNIGWFGQADDNSMFDLK